MSEIVEQAREALADTKCSDEMVDFFRVGLVRELVAEVERLNGLLASSADEAKSLRKRLADKPKGLRGW